MCWPLSSARYRGRVTWTAAALIALSAVLHAGWNYVSKRRSPTMGFFSIAAATAAVLMIPVLVANVELVDDVPGAVWLLLVFTGVAQAVYVHGLAGAYAGGDISLAYPLARALPVLAVAGVGFLLGRGDQIGTLSLIGMVLILIGCVVLPLPHFRRLVWADYRGVVYVMAAVAAIGTTGYTLIDDGALTRLESLIDDVTGQTRVTLFYISLQAGATALGIVGLTVARSVTRRQLRAVIGDRSLLRTGMLTGAVITATYGLALAAMAYVSDVSYVAAFRQLSIPIGAALGIVVAGESRHRPKLIGVAVITFGLVLVGLG